VTTRTIAHDVIAAHIEEQQGETIHDHSRFQIDS